MIKRALGWLKRRRAYLLLGAVLLPLEMAGAGTDFLGSSHFVGSGPARPSASVSGLPYFTVVIEPNYLSSDPVGVSLMRTINGRIRWNLALTGGDVTLATQFAWGVPVPTSPKEATISPRTGAGA